MLKCKSSLIKSTELTYIIKDTSYIFLNPSCQRNIVMIINKNLGHNIYVIFLVLEVYIGLAKLEKDVINNSGTNIHM